MYQLLQDKIRLFLSGGTGKTYMLSLLLSKIRQGGHIALAAAASGVAAQLLPGGRTAHATFKLPFDLSKDDTPTCNITKRSSKAKVLQKTSLIVWDECSMVHKTHLEAVDRTLRDILDKDVPMGGLTLVLAGDFR